MVSSGNPRFRLSSWLYEGEIDEREKIDGVLNGGCDYEKTHEEDDLLVFEGVQI